MFAILSAISEPFNITRALLSLLLPQATAAKPVPIPPSAAKPVKAASKLVKATIKVAVGKPAGIKKPHTPVPRKAKALPSSRAEKVTTRKKA